MTINARSENDLDYDTVLDKVKTSSGANYSIHKEKPKPVEQIKPVVSYRVYFLGQFSCLVPPEQVQLFRPVKSVFMNLH